MKITKKKASRPKSKSVSKPGRPEGRFARFRALGEERLSQIESMFLDGKPAAQIARVIQEDWMELLDMKTDSIARELVNYRKQVIDPRVLMAGNLLPEDVKEDIVKRMRGQLDVLHEMKTLCIDQTARYRAFCLRAQKGPERIKDEQRAATEGQRLHAMLKDLAQLQMDAGIIPRAPRVVSSHVHFQRTAAEDAYYAELEIKKDEQNRVRALVDMMRNEDVVDAEFEDADTDEVQEAGP